MQRVRLRVSPVHGAGRGDQRQADGGHQEGQDNQRQVRAIIIIIIVILPTFSLYWC